MRPQPVAPDAGFTTIDGPLGIRELIHRSMDDRQEQHRVLQWLRAQGVTPYHEVMKWRRRFWALLLMVTGATLAGLIAMRLV